MSVFIKSLKQSGHLDGLHLTICNVGSRKLTVQDDYGSQEWQVFAPNLTIYGFDADADACEEANADLESKNITWTERHIPLAIANVVGESTLYVTKHPMCSSLYEPNEPYLKRFGQLPELMNLDFTLEIETTSLDSFCQLENIYEIDFLQTDVQGADILVLQGGIDILKRSVLAIKSEVIFSDLYINQPLFADLDLFIRNQGFTLFDLRTAYRTRRFSPIVSNIHPGQILWGDGYYFRDLIAEDYNQELKKPEKILKLGCITDILGFSDYSLEILEYLTINYGNDPKYNFADNIVESLAQFPELVKQGLDSLPIINRIQDYISEGYLQKIMNENTTSVTDFSRHL